MNFLHRLLLAMSYVTCLHLVYVPTEESDSKLEGLSKYLPLVGMLIGLMLFGAAYLLYMMHAPRLLMGLVLAVAWLALSNGLHFDGLMDTADGIFSHQSRERMLEIMSDPRVGNFGVMVGFCTFLIKAVSLGSLPPIPLLLTLLTVPAWSRWCETFAIGCFRYLKESGKGKIWHDSTNVPGDLVVSTIAPLSLLIVACILGHWPVILITFFTIASGLGSAAWLNWKLGGHTGDTYGATVELAEAGALLATALSIPGFLCRF